MSVNKNIIDGLYRNSVGIVILNHEKQIFIGKRIKS